MNATPTGPIRELIPCSAEDEPLTPAEATFVRFLFRKPNPLEAIKAAFPELAVEEDGTPVTNQRLGTMAWSVMQRSNVRARIDELRHRALDDALCSLTDHLRTLAELRDEAREAAQYSAAVAAETNRGKAAGMYVQRTQRVPYELSPTEILDRLGNVLPGILADNPNLVLLAMQSNPALLDQLKDKAEVE